MGTTSDDTTTAPHRRPLPAGLTRDIERAGYYPALVADVVASAVAGDEVVSHLVHQETTFDHDTVRRHITVLALTTSRLVIAHADDHAGDHDEPTAEASVATATTESVPLSSVRGVMLTHVVTDPAAYRPGSLGRELTVTIGWGAVSRLDLVPATCGDSGCEADHGYEGTVTADDIGLRISADADGEAALAQAMTFARELSRRSGVEHRRAGRLLPAPGLRRRRAGRGAARRRPQPRRAGRGGTRRRPARAGALAQRGGRAGRRAGLRPAAPAQRPRAVPAQPAARGPSPRRRLPVDHRHQHGHVRHRPAAGGPRTGRLRGPGARRGPAAQRAVLGERPRPAALAAAADRVRAGGRRRGGRHPDRSRLLRRARA